MIQLQYTLNSDDYQKLLQHKDNNKRKGYIAVFVTFVISIAIFVSKVILDINMAEVLKFLIPLFGFLLGGICGLVLTLVLQNKISFTTTSNRGYTAPMTLQACEEYLTFTNQFAETKYFWSTYSEGKETNEHFILTQVFGKNCYTLIPKRGFGSAADLEEFRSLLRTRIGAVPMDKSAKVVKFNSQSIIVYLLLLVAIVAMVFTQLSQSR